ncbi:phage tail tube protein [Cryobacterium fucosi]|uniref:Uncharacterized protein n=1 Tax=Cryobacterium fucosi TaxID=1259157 RepID=A0A4R9B3E6_9MICO|nr:phage tail tube protein [Cryobacterium fucosi]TFD74734.1 hypothetical protein E3T48_12475 [Cryobacterium fucosi]
MTTQQDAALGLKKEATFGTYIAPDKFFEITQEDFAWNPTFSSGSAMRYGKRVIAGDRRVLVKEEVTGSLTVEGITKTLGAMFEAALGSGVSTIIGAGPGYQQLFTPTATDPLPSYTIQASIPTVGGGAAQPMSFLGCVCTGFELDAGNAGVPMLKFNWVGKSVDTTQAFVTPSYVAGTSLMSFVGGSIRIGGTVTVPTNVALASGGTAAANVVDAKFTYENGVDSGGFFFGGGGKRGRAPVVGGRGLSGSLTVEYDTNVLRDAFLAQTDLALVLKFAHSVAITAGVFPTLEITIPVVRLDGELPKANGGDVITQSVDFTGVDGRVAAQPVYVAIVTAETAI